MEIQIKNFLFALFIFLNPTASLSLRTLPPSNPCDPRSLPDPHSFRSDQLTVLINGYSESRIPLLRSTAATYAAASFISSILILWGNPSTPHQTLSQLSYNLSRLYSAGASITLHHQKTTSLNSRFLPRPSIKTLAVLVCDDDIEPDPKSLQFAFRVWQSNPDRIIGFFARSHDLDLGRKTWIYTVHPDKYSIILTKFMILKTNYLFSYTCGGYGGRERAEMRSVVDEMRNCEDILMNFVVADETGEGPVMVGAERVRDWGDPRNEAERGAEVAVDEAAEVGLSSLKRGGGEHRKRRGDCIREFHKILGRMPLRYSYGKVVNSVGEQGLCEKGGKLMFCDQQLLD